MLYRSILITLLLGFSVVGCQTYSRHPVATAKSVQSWLKHRVPLPQVEQELIHKPEAEFAALSQRNDARPEAVEFKKSRFESAIQSAKRFLEQVQDKDEIWYYDVQVGPVAGEGGYAIVREGKVIAWYRTIIS